MYYFRSNVLHCIPLSPPIVTLEQAKRDFRRERVLFNDVPFIPDSVDVHRCHAFTLTLRRLVQRLLHSSGLNSDPDFIADLIMQRACRHTLPYYVNFLVMFLNFNFTLAIIGPVQERTVSLWFRNFFVPIFKVWL